MPWPVSAQKTRRWLCMSTGQPLGRAAQWACSCGPQPSPINSSMRSACSNDSAHDRKVEDRGATVDADGASSGEEDEELAGSRLGRKEHWDQVYAEELANLEEHGDEGELWSALCVLLFHCQVT